MRPTLRTLFLHGGDILKSPGMQIAKENMQHGSVSVFEHSVCVALVCLWLVHRDFELNDTERDMIKKHMFPLNPAPPRFKETAVLCLADKYCALRETVLQRKKENK